MIDRTSYEPLYVQVKKSIIAEIENGSIRPGDKLMSENQMLQYYNVGRVTIRAALSELTAEGVIRKEQGKGSFCVGLPEKGQRLNIDLLLDIGDAYFMPTYVLSGVTPVLEQNNCHLRIHDNKRDEFQIVKMMWDFLKQGTDGVILVPVTRERWLPEMAAVLEQYHQQGIPVVSLFGSLPYKYCINMDIDDEYGVEIATRYLLECGHRKILGLFYEKNRDPARRVRGFRMATRDVPDAEVYEITTADYEEYLLGLVREKKITAIQCYNDRVAVECLRLFAENGIRVPRDISLVGFDDSELSVNAIPRLTTMSHPKDHVGSAAAKVILRKIQNPEEPQNSVTYRPGLVIRQSVRNLNEEI